MHQFVVPDGLARTCSSNEQFAAWLRGVPALVAKFQEQWSLSVGPPFADSEGTCAWVAPATRSDGSPAVLKLALPHMEGRDEIAGLRFWGGHNTVRLLESDETSNAMLLEQCQPGTTLAAESETEQDAVLAGLLPQFWSEPDAQVPFRPLSDMLEYWKPHTLAERARWPDEGIVQEGFSAFDELLGTTRQRVVLFTDFHAHNVLRARRQPWLAIDPKPFVGDPAYDATQHLFNSMRRLLADPERVILDFSARLGVDSARVRLWTFARAAAEPRDTWESSPRFEVARKLAP